MLKQDKNFTPCPADPNDELYNNGIFVFNITKMLQYIENNKDKFVPEEVNVKDFYSGFSRLNESHIDSVDITKPGIIAEIAPGRYNLIDGNHRMEKARRSGKEKYMVYRIRTEQHIPFLIEKRAYESYIEYYNDKLRG